MSQKNGLTGWLNPWDTSDKSKSKKAARKRAQVLVTSMYAFFNSLIAAVCGRDTQYRAIEVSLLESLPGCPRQAGHADYPIDLIGERSHKQPHFSLLLPACSMPAHLVLWPGSHRLMQHVADNNHFHGNHNSGGDFHTQTLQESAGMQLGETIAPVEMVVSGGHACAFLGHVVHAGAQSPYTCPHYRWHCYVQEKGSEKDANSANGLPMCVAVLCTDSLRLIQPSD